MERKLRSRCCARLQSRCGVGVAVSSAAVLGAVLWDSFRAQEQSLDSPDLSMDQLLRRFQDSPEYLAASGWHAEQGTFVPGERRSRRWARNRTAARTALDEESAPGPALPLGRVTRLSGFRRYSAKAPRNRACGAGRVRTLHHIMAVMDGVDPVYVMEALMNPAYGIKWNPSVQRVLLRHQQRVHKNAVLREVFTREALASRDAAPSLLDGGDHFDVVTQVIEMPLPRIVKRVTGPRHTADFLAARFDCARRRGYVLGTSLGSEAVANFSGVQKGQELCMTATLIAPATEDQRSGTKVHIVTHFDPQVTTRQLRRIVNIAVGRNVRELLKALYRKAAALQASGRHPYVACPTA